MVGQVTLDGSTRESSMLSSNPRSQSMNATNSSNKCNLPHWPLPHWPNCRELCCIEKNVTKQFHVFYLLAGSFMLALHRKAWALARYTYSNTAYKLWYTSPNLTPFRSLATTLHCSDVHGKQPPQCKVEYVRNIPPIPWRNEVFLFFFFLSGCAWHCVIGLRVY